MVGPPYLPILKGVQYEAGKEAGKGGLGGVRHREVTGTWVLGEGSKVATKVGTDRPEEEVEKLGEGETLTVPVVLQMEVVAEGEFHINQGQTFHPLTFLDEGEKVSWGAARLVAEVDRLCQYLIVQSSDACLLAHKIGNAVDPQPLQFIIQAYLFGEVLREEEAKDGLVGDLVTLK